MRWIAQPQSRGKRPGQSGQGAVEFALVGGLFFFLVFSIVNAGFFLYGRSAVEHAADIGVATISAEGNCPQANGGLCVGFPTGYCPNSSQTTTADEVAICRMYQAGITSAPLVKVVQIVLWKETESNGTFIDDPTDNCGPFSNLACEDIYNVAGATLNSGGVLPWPAHDRTVDGINGPDFARLAITFNFSLIGTTGSIQMTTSNVFRLEPQQ